MKARIDGLSVLKGGQGKATIYIDRTEMKEALDLNEKEVCVTLNQAELPVCPVGSIEEAHAIIARGLAMLERVMKEKGGE